MTEWGYVIARVPSFVSLRGVSFLCHCEERSDEAISDAFVRNDKREDCHCEEQRDEAISDAFGSQGQKGCMSLRGKVLRSGVRKHTVTEAILLLVKPLLGSGRFVRFLTFSFLI
ncbi:MAG: hypothetical protein N2748_06220 [candidate division WOR-3 bacterium]|nr:hypothetical protein [candidate division WOR-3 bacterium]